MSLNSTLGSRPPAQPALPVNLQVAGKAVGVQNAPASGKVAARLPTVDPVSLQDDIVSLSILGLQAPGDVAASASDSAQNLVSRIAQNLFGSDAQTTTVSYNLASLKTQPVLPAVGTLSESSRDVTFSLNQSINFTGTGQIATADGQVFDFEVAIKYAAKVEASEPITIEPPDMLVLTGKPLPAIEFPGSLNDLFKLLSRELRTDVSGAGNMTLRLLRLVDQAALLAPRARHDDPEATPVERAKAAATAYASANQSASAPGEISEA